MEIVIENVEGPSFSYTIPSFPVITVDLMKVTYTNKGKLCQGVVNAIDNPTLHPGKYICTSHCEVNIEGENYIVLWKLHPDNRLSLCPTPMKNDQVPTVHISDAADVVHVVHVDEGTHCLPFKVLGTCYSGSRQKALEEGYEYMYEYNRRVFVKLEAEPENQHDKNAVAVYIMSTDDYEKVGYIASELTKYIHAPLKQSLLEVSVKQIRFRTTYLLMGFYLTINITKKGAWDSTVVKASCKVY